MIENEQSIWVLFIFFATIVGLIKYQNYPERVFGAVLISLYGLNIVTTQQVLDKFSNQGLLTLMLLMTCSLALEKTKALRALGRYVMQSSYQKTWLRLLGLTAVSSAFLNNTAVVATMLSPIRNNKYHSPSLLLLPLSYAAIFGGTLTLVGTSTNLIVNSMVLDQGLPPLGFFEFTPIGASVIVVCGGLLFLLSKRLPNKPMPRLCSSQYFIDARVASGSTLAGKSVEQNGLRSLESLFLVEILRRGRLISPVSPSEGIEDNDRLIFSGDIQKVTRLKQFNGLSTYAHENGLPLKNLHEALIKPDSVLIGSSMKQVGFRALFDAAVVAMRRDGESISGQLGDVVFRAGDCLVLAVGKDFHQRRNITKNFYLMSDKETEHALQPWQEKVALVGFVTAIALAALGWFTLFKTTLVLLSLLLFTGCLSSNEIMRRLPMKIWLIIASALLLSQALLTSGVLTALGAWIQTHHHIITPLLGLIMVYTLTWLLTELVTNNAAAVLIFPIAYTLALTLSVAPKAYILAVAFGASASFISPYGYQTNLMVFNAGQYKLSDFAKIGIPISLAYGITVITAIYWFVGV